MVYSNKFVVCVLVNGIPLKELANGEVHIPFNTEYVLRFRNKNNRRAVVKFTIDGENVSDNGYIIPANDFIDIKRHANKDAAFKLVDLESPDAVDAGKNGPNIDKIKGVVQAEFYLEKEPIKYHPLIKYPLYPHVRPPMWLGNSDITTMGAQSMGNISFNTCQTFPNTKDACTVEGSTTGQIFSSTYIDIEENSTVLKLFLKGIENIVEYHSIHSIRQENKRLEEEIKLLEENRKLKAKLKELQS